MKIIFAFLSVAVAVALAGSLAVNTDSEITVTPSQFDPTKHCLPFVVKKAVSTTYTGAYEVRVIRRSHFAEKDSSLWLCKNNENCTMKGPDPDYKQLINVTKEYNMIMWFVGKDFDDLGEITLRVCEGECAVECENDCSGHGACKSGIEACFCDVGMHNRGTDCGSSGWDWYNIIILICCVVAAVIVGVIVLVCCCCCGVCRKRN